MMSTPEAPLVVAVDGAGTESVVFALRGELDPHTAPQLAAAVEQALTDETREVVLDLSGILFVDSSGLRVIISTYRTMTDRDGRFVLRAPSATTRRILDVTGLADLIEVEA
jgi:anti-anti-sigma factor